MLCSTDHQFPDASLPALPEGNTGKPRAQLEKPPSHPDCRRGPWQARPQNKQPLHLTEGNGVNLGSVRQSLQLTEASGGRRCREGNWATGSCLQRAQRDSSFNGCSEMGPPTVRGLALERTTVGADFPRILVCNHVLPWSVNVMTFPLQSQGVGAWQSFAVLQQKSHWDLQPSPASGLLALFTPVRSWHNERDEQAEEYLWWYKDYIDIVPLCPFHVSFWSF